MENTPLVAIDMGSQSDLDTLKAAAAVLTAFGVRHQMRVIADRKVQANASGD